MIPNLNFTIAFAVHTVHQMWTCAWRKKTHVLCAKSVYRKITHKHANPLICQASYTNPVSAFKGTIRIVGGGSEREEEKEREREGGRRRRM